MSHAPKAMHAFSRLLSYPDERTTEAAELLYVLLKDEIPAAAKAISEFGEVLERNEIRQVEEIFTSTFDVNPNCALEVGWHLFGEEYARGMFLVRMREELRKYGLSESVELPDHISHVLAIIAEMPEAEVTAFVRACVQPAVEKMREALDNHETPYRHVVSGLAEVMRMKWGEAKRDGEDILEKSDCGDPLRAFPVANVSCEGGCSCSGPELVTLPEREIESGAGGAATEDRS